jgi:hypothetical protein
MILNKYHIAHNLFKTHIFKNFFMKINVAWMLFQGPEWI